MMGQGAANFTRECPACQLSSTPLAYKKSEQVPRGARLFAWTCSASPSRKSDANDIGHTTPSTRSERPQQIHHMTALVALFAMAATLSGVSLQVGASAVSGALHDKTAQLQKRLSHMAKARSTASKIKENLRARAIKIWRLRAGQANTKNCVESPASLAISAKFNHLPLTGRLQASQDQFVLQCLAPES